MSNKTVHIILTKYNVGIYDSMKNPDGWMKKRLELFKLCAMSVDAAIKKAEGNGVKYEWVISLDPLTDLKAEEDICKGIPFNTRCKSHMSKYDVAIIKKARKRTIIGLSQCPTFQAYDTLITSRLDNDDMIMPNFLADIAEAVKHQNNLPIALNFTTGLVYDYNNKVVAKSGLEYGNPFISVAEKVSNNPLTVFCANHLKVADKVFENKGAVSQLPGDGWIRIIHDDNINNRMPMGGTTKFDINIMEVL